MSEPRLWAVVVLWAIAVSIGLGALVAYSMQPGAAAAAPASWPTDSSIRRAEGKPTLVMIVHPQCSCSRASVGELARLMTTLGDRTKAVALFVRPQGMPTSWEQTDLYESAQRIDGVDVVTDEDGLEAHRFGAMTSGQVYVYGADERLLFSGGITPARAHMGESVGRRKIVSAILRESGATGSSSVYGCALEES